MSEASTKRLRTLQACHNCRKRKTRCDGEQPVCGGCILRGESCGWAINLVTASGAPYQDTRWKEGLRGSSLSEDPLPPGSGSLKHGSNGEMQHAVQELPPLPQLRKLLSLFWTHHHNVELCGFLHRSSFEAEINEAHNHFLTYAIVSLSLLYVSDEVAKVDYGFQDAITASDRFALEARNAARSKFDTPSVVNVQANLILGLRELVAWRNWKSWMHTGTAIRMAQALRLEHEYNQRHSPIERERRRRTFWACIVMDRLVAFCTSRQQSLQVPSCVLYLPCSDTAYAFGEDVHGLDQTELLSKTVSSISISQHGIMPFFITALILWGKIIALYLEVGRKTARTRPTDPASVFYKTERELDTWIGNLPAGMLWSVQNYRAFQAIGYARTFINFHLLLRHAACVAHQEYLPQYDMPAYDPTTINANFDSAGIPFEHRDEELIVKTLRNANEIVDIVTFLSNDVQSDQHSLESTFSGCTIMTAAMILLWSQYADSSNRAHDSNAVTAKDKLAFLVKLLRNWEGKWKVVQAWVETIHILERLYICVYSDPEAVVRGLQSGVEDYSPELCDDEQSLSHLSSGDGLPDPTTICQRLYHTIRIMSVTSLEASEFKRKSLGIFIEKLKQNIWFNNALLEYDGAFDQVPLDSAGLDNSSLPPTLI